MGDILYSILFFIVAIGVLITFHEFGHFWVARKLGVTVLKFSIGFGPTIYKFPAKNSITEYVIAAIPLGGYVRMLDENVDTVKAELRHTAFNRQPLYKRSAIVAAGPLANFLLAGILYMLVYTIGSTGLHPTVGEIQEHSLAAESGFLVGDHIIEVDGKGNQSWDQNHFYLLDRMVSGDEVAFTVSRDGLEKVIIMDFNQLENYDLSNQSIEEFLGFGPRLPIIQPIVAEVMSGSPAAQAGLISGDHIVQINGSEITEWRDLIQVVSESNGVTLTIQFLRDGQLNQVLAVAEPVQIGDQQIWRIGIRIDAERQLIDSDYAVTVRHGPVDALIRGFETTWSTTALTMKLLIDLLTLQGPADSVGGPIAIAEHAGNAAQSGLNNYLTFLALLSVTLGILNLLPIPVLDGGHLMFHLYEAIVGSPPKERVLILANQIGFVLLLGLMGFAFYNDLSRIF